MFEIYPNTIPILLALYLPVGLLMLLISVMFDDERFVVEHPVTSLFFWILVYPVIVIICFHNIMKKRKND